MAELAAWTDRDDREQRCGHSGSAVADSESVGLFLFKRTGEKLKMDAFFRRERLAAYKLTQISNDCGESDGVSVCRRNIPDEELLAAAKTQAAQRTERVFEGVALVNAGPKIHHAGGVKVHH